MPGIKDIIPAYSSITVVYDAAIIRNQHHATSAFQFIKQYAEDSIQHVDWNKTPSSRQIEIPVCYDSSLAPDLPALASKKNYQQKRLEYWGISPHHHYWLPRKTS